MKKILLLIAALLAVITLFNLKASAQTVTANVPLSIVLADAFSITLGPTPDVVFNYSTAADYAGSKTVAKANHFTVVSNKSYSVAVKATAEFNTIVGNATPVPLSVVQVSIDPSTPTTGATYATPALTTTNQALITAASPTVATAFNVNYSIPTAAALIGKQSGTYATNVVYTITQP
ncbi:hypothetical protein TH53_02580 [Pedobacter lusitanus]|uniref:Uncharacterized protein n=1 Tax=Pedobacter lusitanus TaxID=1503925 RepID=A0A0D0GN62_9SPHI|nr:hypothetical protein [Pedobacter lusitanus]KIO78647.1 hypothetical protein TH53_02580 [Pedobacter lusitanus]